jgi:3-deoxy-D-manno-octulosonic-acid transferase
VARSHPRSGRRGVRLALLSATLPEGSSRLRRPARALLRPAYARLDAVGAIAGEDAARFGELGVPPERVEVTGDARFDQVLARASATGTDSVLLGRFAGYEGLTLVAGSTWAADLARLLPAVAGVRAAGARLRLFLAPHEPTAAHVAEAEGAMAEAGLPVPTRLSAAEAGGEPGESVLVDRVGVLGELYALADLAYVGGGWGTAGLHSVLEPAAFAAPVLFGPRHGNAREAAELVRLGGAVAAEDAPALAEALRRWAGDDGERRRAGAAAAAYVRERAGAAERSASLLERLL